MTLAEDTMLEKRYRIDRMLGQGGMGAIYRGFDTRLNRPVAIKENFFQTPHSIRQFEREAILLADLTHPNLPRVIDHFSYEGQQYLVMDFIEGQDLWEMVKQQQKPLAEAQAVPYLIQVCGAVQYLHRRRPPLIHRDIKPQNIKITPDGRAVLVDFGIAKLAEAGERTSTGARGVTPGYSSPEQYSRTGTSPTSDVYSLGATLYTLVTGQKPPDSVSLMLNPAEFKPPIALNAAITPQLSEAIMYAMRPQPEDRPSSVAAWQSELERLLDVPLLTFEEDEEDAQPTVMSTRPGFLVGPDGFSTPLKPGTRGVILGWAKTSDVQVNDPATSRQHALVEFDGEKVTVYDEGSPNGTFINEQRVGPEGLPFKLGDHLRIGQSVYTLSSTAPIAPLSTAPRPIMDERVETAAPPQTAEVLRKTSAVLETSAVLRSTSAVSSSAPAALVPPVKRGPPWALLGAGVVVLLLVVGGAFFFLGGDTNDDAAAASLLVAASLPVAFQDDFSSNVNGWYTGELSGEYGDTINEIINGKYRRTVRSKRHIVSWLPIPNFSAKDFLLSVDMTIVEAPDQAKVGLTFHENSNGEFNRIDFGKAGDYRVGVWTKDGWQKIQGWTDGRDVNIEPGVTNTFLILVQGSSVTVSVNGQVWGMVSDARLLSEAGKVGWSSSLKEAGQTLIVEYDNLVIKKGP